MLPVPILVAYLTQLRYLLSTIRARRTIEEMHIT